MNVRISAKSRYALAALTTMAMQEETKECVTVISISDSLGISKIYLEQVFSLLKRAQLVISVKGAQGGYRLSRSASSITALHILSAMEQRLFEQTGSSAGKSASYIDHVLLANIWKPLESALKETLAGITLRDLASKAEEQKGGDALMFYI
jgi:Rrf2 family protein